MVFEEEGLADLVVKRLGLPDGPANMAEWHDLVRRVKQPKHEVNIAVVGKYTQNGDAYISIAEALKHGGIASDARVNIEWIESDALEEPGLDMAARFAHTDGLIVAPGFGERGVEGKIEAIRYARESGLPFFGICYGLQMAVIEFARHACGLEGANTEEVNPNTPHPVVHILPEQKHVIDKGASMRLGAYPCRLTQDSLAARLYGDGHAFRSATGTATKSTTSTASRCPQPAWSSAASRPITAWSRSSSCPKSCIPTSSPPSSTRSSSPAPTAPIPCSPG